MTAPGAAEEYLDIERDVPAKHEFYRGEMFAMAGASREHNLVFSEYWGDFA